MDDIQDTIPENEGVPIVIETVEDALRVVEEIKSHLQTGDDVPRFLIPECCREGWDSCKHVINREKVPERKNPGL